MQFSFPPASPSRWLKWSPPSSSWPSSTPPGSASNPTSPSSMRCTSPSVSWQIQIEFLQLSLRESHLQKQLSGNLRPWKRLASFRQYVEVGLGFIAWWEHFCKFSICNNRGWGGEISGLTKIVDDSKYHDKTLDSVLTEMMSLSLPGNISVLLLVAPYLPFWWWSFYFGPIWCLVQLLMVK